MTAWSAGSTTIALVQPAGIPGTGGAAGRLTGDQVVPPSSLRIRPSAVRAKSAPLAGVYSFLTGTVRPVWVQGTSALPWAIATAAVHRAARASARALLVRRSVDVIGSDCLRDIVLLRPRPRSARPPL